MSADWTQKIIALLHDLPDKSLSRKVHEDLAKQLLCDLLEVEELDDTQWKNAKKADVIASSFDRAAFPGQVTVHWPVVPWIRHPLAGRVLPLFAAQTSDPDAAHKAVRNAALTLWVKGDLRKSYLRLWRSLCDETREEEQRLNVGLGPDWGLLPADTRLPDHSLWDHADMTAAVVSALEQPALLVFSLGPVQDFIATARRTQDLWMGSYILSYLAWQAMRVVVKDYGPDVVLYPALRGQPLVDHWLHEEGILDSAPDADRLRLATLPNKFVALLPKHDAECLAALAAEAAHQAWYEVAGAVRDFLQTQITTDAAWEMLWQTQIPRLLEVYWTIYPAPPKDPATREAAEGIFKQAEQLLHSPPDWPPQDVFRIFCAIEERRNKQLVRLGTAYGPWHKLSQRAFDARKGLRDFVAFTETGEKCTMCGQRVALPGEEVPRRKARQHWGNLAKTLREYSDREGRPYHVAIKPRGAERLCTVCATKRFAQLEFFEGRLWDKEAVAGFPSTTTIATAPFTYRLLDTLWGKRQVKRSVRGRLERDFNRFVQALENSRIPATVARKAIPLLSRLVQRHNMPPQAATFLRYDGRLLLPESYTQDRFRNDFQLNLTPDEIEAVYKPLRRLLTSAEKADIPLPPRYFAVLLLDGDHMGRWLSGELAPLLGHTLHPQAAHKLHSDEIWAPALDMLRPLAPALHKAISHALANFALRLVPWVIEKRYPGRLVYAGGDDVLALLPAEHVLAAARELRALYSGEAVRDGDQLRIVLGDPDSSGFLTWLDKETEERLLTMGPMAGASAGIAIAHHLQPLDGTLAAARRAEHAAKELYGRDAIVVHFLRRSGEELRVGARWSYPNGPTDTLALIEMIRARMASALQKEPTEVDIQGHPTELSMNLAHIFLAEAHGLTGLPLKAIESALRRVLTRQRGERLSIDEGREQATRLAPDLAALAMALNRHYADGPEGAGRPKPGPQALADWLLLARFLAQGGGED